MTGAQEDLYRFYVRHNIRSTEASSRILRLQTNLLFEGFLL